MHYISTSIFVLLIININTLSLYSCIRQSFQKDCKSQLFQCTNSAQCSYQLHQNSRHIFISQKSQMFPQLYFSNQIARNLYVCLQKKCNLPAIDEEYPKTLPFDSCLIEVYDICKGNIQSIFENPHEESMAHVCYRKYCNFPQLSSQ